MKNRYKQMKYILLITLIGIASSCTKNFEEMNTDSKNPVEVSGELLFSSAQKELVDQISSTNVNVNVFKLFAQQWTETTYIDEVNYNIFNRKIPDRAFRSYYINVLTPLDEASQIIKDDKVVGKEAEQKNKLAIIEVLKVFSYHNLVNIFGNIPYSESNDIDNISPKYEDAKTIYADLLKRLDAAIKIMDDSKDSFTNRADLIYNGDIASWIKFAYSLKLKIAVNQIDAVDMKAVVESVKDKVFSSASDNALLQYKGAQPNTNPLYSDLVASGRNDFVPANTLVDLMSDISDPRMDSYFTNKIDGKYKGGVYGSSSSYEAHSHIADVIHEATFPGILMTYSEVQFYLAEAADKGLIPDPAKYYDEGIKASFSFWKTSGVTDYIAANPYVDIKSIAVQSYLAAYTRGDIAYTTYRRLDWPKMNVPEAAETSDGSVPARFTYPIGEQSLNTANYNEAAAAIGGDKLETKLFWDKN